MAKKLQVVLSDGETRTLETPPDVSLDDFYEVLQWTQQRRQEWLHTEDGDGAVRRDAVIEVRVVDTEPGRLGRAGP